MSKSDFKVVEEFENKIASFYGAPYAVAVDCCTHAIELCLRQQKIQYYTIPKRTYLSVPFLATKLDITFSWRDEDWTDFYFLGGTGIIDAAVLWKKDSYIPNTFMCISFQYKKHLSLGRGGIILTNRKKDAIILKKMSYDGRLPNIPWREQDIDTVGYHYYMTPEIAALGLKKLETAINTTPKKWTVTDWPDLTKMEIFK
jgi:dTDP-4-amino-4,6-dideoxygalactose transaminase|tara:strand:+ start:11714 stop:12313 length:600 start_codon:yes stop_codon:yes gene_type:complete